MKKVQVKGIFQSDTRRFHRFEIKAENDFVVGSLYFARGEDVPDVVEITLCTKAEAAVKTPTP